MGGVASVLIPSVLIPVVTELVKLFVEPPPAEPPQLAEVATVQHKTLEEIIPEARLAVGVDCVSHYNFVVGGQTGAGKSSFIKAMLALKGKNAPPIGEAETTHDVKSYSSPSFAPFLKLWDVPGAGTLRHPASTYFQDKKLYVFDAILILTADRFLQVDFDIYKSAQSFHIPCVFVISKCDIAIENKAKRENITAFEASQRLRVEVAKSFIEGLENAGIKDSPPRLFFISSEYFYAATQGDGDEHGAYSIYDRRARKWDDTLASMDVKLLLQFIQEAAIRRRARR